MALTTIGDQKTPGRPVEIAFAPETGLPSPNQIVTIIAHRGASGASGSSGVANYSPVQISNSADVTAAQTEAEGYFGVGSELVKAIVAAINANAGGSNFPLLNAIPLDSADTDFGPADAALTAVKTVRSEFIVSPYDGADATLRGKLEATAREMSGAQRVENNQFGSVGCAFTRSIVNPASMPIVDSQFFMGFTMRDTGTGAQAPAYSIAEACAAAVAPIAAEIIPFNPADGIVIRRLAPPAKASDFYTIGGGLESETILAKGWVPLRVLPNGTVAYVRTVTSRITVDGTTPAAAYYDVQDFQVLYFWRKTVFTRLNQTDFKNVKASTDVAKQVKSELIRLAQTFEDLTMFQAVTKLAPFFKVQRSLSDRHRFDVLTPVNVIPGLHTIATRVEAGVLFDTFSV